MKKIFIITLMSILFFSCENSAIDKPQPQDDPQIEPIVSPITEDPVDITLPAPIPDDEPVIVIQNPEPTVEAVIAKLPVFYIPASSTSRNVTVDAIEDKNAFFTGVGPTLITSWGDGQEVTDGATFTKTVYSNTVTFTVAIDVENNIIHYNGLFPDNEGYINITYYPETETFDIVYGVIYDLTVREDPEAFYGEMYGAQIDGTTYTGTFTMFTYLQAYFKVTDKFGSQIFAFRYNIDANEERVVATELSTIQRTNYQPDDTFPSIVPMTYDGVFWDEMTSLNSAEIATREDVLGDGWLGKWVTYADVGLTGRTFTFILDTPDEEQVEPLVAPEDLVETSVIE